MKKLILSIIAASALIISSCKEDDPAVIVVVASCNDGIMNQGETEIDCGGPNCQPCVDATATCSDGIQNGDETGIDFGGSCAEIITVSGEIGADTTWTANNIYVLGGKVVIGMGVTLTIEPGTIIKGKPGSGSLASALIVQRDSKIEAVGTAEKPIIFTAEADNIVVGQTAGTNLNETDRGLWGGLLVLGRASASLPGDVTEYQIEGIPAEDTFGTYGPGDALNDADNSGNLKYISIRHGGALIGEGNEINGLTLGAVGSGTTIDNIEIVGNVDDGVEFFGGTVNPTNLLVWSGGDDGLDIDQAYSGTIDNAIVIAGDAQDSDLEIDGGEGSTNASFTMKNVTLVGAGTDSNKYADFRSGARGTVENIYAYGFSAASIARIDGNSVAQNFLDGLLIFNNWEVVGAGASIFQEAPKDLESALIVSPDLPTRADAWTTEVTSGSETVGADTSAFSWTYANAKASLGF